MPNLLCVNLIVEVEEASEILSDTQIKVAERVLSYCAVDHGYSNIVIVDERTIRRLNMDHRGLDEVTDVLAFSMNHEGYFYGEETEGRYERSHQEFVLPPGAQPYLGEVVICFPQAMKQASVFHISVQEEVNKLVAHGFLHLMGYDHVESEEERKMNLLQEKIVAEVIGFE